MSHQDAFSNNRTEPTRSSKPDDDDDGMQKKDENVAHAQDGIKLNKLKNSGRLQNSPPTALVLVVKFPHLIRDESPVVRKRPVKVHQCSPGSPDAYTSAEPLEEGCWLSRSARSWMQSIGGLRYSDECRRDRTFDSRHTQC